MVEKEKEKLQLLVSKIKHILTHQIIFADFYLLETNTRPTLSEDFIWINENELNNYALPRLLEVLIEKL